MTRNIKEINTLDSKISPITQNFGVCLLQILLNFLLIWHQVKYFYLPRDIDVDRALPCHQSNSLTLVLDLVLDLVLVLVLLVLVIMLVLVPMLHLVLLLVLVQVILPGVNSRATEVGSE